MPIKTAHPLGRKPSKPEDLDQFSRASKFGVGLDFPPAGSFDWSTDPTSPLCKLVEARIEEHGVDLDLATLLKPRALRVGPGPKAVTSACYFFGGLVVGFDMPAAYVEPARLPTPGGETIRWDLPLPPVPDPKAKKSPPEPEPKHGKVVLVSGVEPSGVWVIAWGARVFFTWQAFHKHTHPEAVGELFAVVDPDWTAAMALKHPDAIDWAGLRKAFGFAAPVVEGSSDVVLP